MTANRPDLLSPQEVRRRAERLFRLDQSSIAGVLRRLDREGVGDTHPCHYGREIRESWLLHLSEDDEEGIWPQPGVEFEVLSRAEFHIPPDGPVIIEDRLVPQQSDPAGRVESFVASIVRPDARSARPSGRHFPRRPSGSSLEFCRDGWMKVLSNSWWTFSVPGTIEVRSDFRTRSTTSCSSLIVPRTLLPMLMIRTQWMVRRPSCTGAK